MLETINNGKPKKKSGAKKLLEAIENNLRELIREKKELWKRLEEKNKELEALRISYREDLEEAERIQNRLILLWDYYYRKVEILELSEKIRAGVSSEEEKELIKKQLKLAEYNETLEKGFKERKIGDDVLSEIKKRLGIWEDRKLGEKNK